MSATTTSYSWGRVCTRGQRGAEARAGLCRVAPLTGGVHPAV
jgi:hypothetical protein